MSNIKVVKEFEYSDLLFDNISYDKKNEIWYGVDQQNTITQFYIGRDKKPHIIKTHILAKNDVIGDMDATEAKSDRYDASNNYMKFSSVNDKGHMAISPSNLLVVSQTNQDEYIGNTIMSEVIF